jgi:hypothetical protein
MYNFFEGAVQNGKCDEKFISSKTYQRYYVYQGFDKVTSVTFARNQWLLVCLSFVNGYYRVLRSKRNAQIIDKHLYKNNTCKSA